MSRVSTGGGGAGGLGGSESKFGARRSPFSPPRAPVWPPHPPRQIQLSLPILSAAMDTVTEARLAITIAQEGGLGIVHKNMSIEAQAREVQRVKKFESGVIHEPITISPDKTIREV